MDIRIIEGIDSYLPDISNYFRIFYEKEPWGDYKGCDPCFGSLPLKEAPRFTKEQVNCPQCNKPLEPFWSVSRCKSTLSQTNVFVAFFVDDRLKGWIIAKPISEKILAIDYMGLDADLRAKKSKIMMIKDMLAAMSLFFIKKHYPQLNTWADKKLLKIKRVGLHLYCHFEEHAKKMGYQRIQSTTHKTAKNIHLAFKSVGFKLAQKDLPNDRVLFLKQL